MSDQTKCIFLDRDGTLNVHRGLITNVEMFELEKGAAEAVKLINQSEYLAILVTNQSVVARGLCSIDGLKQIHEKLRKLLAKQGAYLDDMIFCPHLPDKEIQNGNQEYQIVCKCRKPLTGMVERMAEKYDIDLANSYIIGDSTVDIQTGIHAGMKTILVETGQAGKDGRYPARADYEAENVLEAVKLILGL